MHTLIIVLTVLVAILLIAVVLIQKSKGGGLSSSFAGGNQVLGVRHTNDFIEKATWTLAGIICVLSIISTRISPSSDRAPHKKRDSARQCITSNTCTGCARTSACF